MFCQCHKFVSEKLQKLLSPLVDLGIRLYMADIFFRSGWLKFQNYLNDDWDSTLYLFESIHPVPFIPPEVAAIMGTSGELVLSTLLALGLFGRFGALGLLLMTGVIQLTMPALHIHLVWGLLLATILARGSGCLSLDALYDRFFSCNKYERNF